MTWTLTQVLALAPDSAGAKAGQALATQRHWTSLGQSPQAIWGLCQGSGKEPYQTQVDLGGPAFRCTCPSRKQPCKHGLGLLLLFASEPGGMPASPPPEWVSAWLAERAKRETRQKAEAPNAAPNEAAALRRVAQREARIARGIEDLDRWLCDTVRRGVAETPERSISSWDTMAARLVDAQAPALARRLQTLSGVSASGTGWQERLAEGLGRLFLLLEGYRRQADLPPDWRAHVRNLIGWTLTQEELLASPGISDRWLVLGRSIDREEKLRVSRSWLWGQATQRPALVLEFAAPGQVLEGDLVPGTVIPAEVVFYASPWPLRALIKTRDAAEPLRDWPGHAALASAQAAYGAALALDPWLDRWPAALDHVWPQNGDEQDWIQDAHGSIWPVARSFTSPWELLALSGGRPLGVFGEWDGRELLPLSVWVDGALVSF